MAQDSGRAKTSPYRRSCSPRSCRVRSCQLHRGASRRRADRSCSCRGCWPPSGAAGAPDRVVERWAATGRRCWCGAGSSTAPGWPSWPPTTGSGCPPPTGICTRGSACWPRHPHVLVDGTLIVTDRLSTPGPTSGVDLWWSGKHTQHGGNIQIVTAPDGWPLPPSPVRPGREHDTTALRAHPDLLPLLAEWTDATHTVLADLGYEGEADLLRIPLKRTAHAPLTDDQRTLNARHAATRALAERGNALLKTTFKALRRVSLCPWRIGAITAAALVLLHHQHGHTT